MSEKLSVTNIKSNIGSVSSLEALEALFEKIKAEDPKRYARLEAAGELENQKKVLGLSKSERKEPAKIK